MDNLDFTLDTHTVFYTQGIMSEKYCLKWNDFQTNVSNSFGLLRNEDYLQDVTIVTDDNEQIAAHKLVLSACSEYFKNIFKRNKSSNLLLCIEGVKSADLGNVLDYIYNGEVKIFQENIDRFLEVAQRFKLEGLLGNKHEESAEDFEEPGLTETNHPIQDTSLKQPKASHEKTIVHNNLDPVDNSEVDQQIQEHMEKLSDGTYTCKICGKSSVKKRTNMRNHIETHLEGLSFDCQHCGKVFRSRNALGKHIHYDHKSF